MDDQSREEIDRISRQVLQDARLVEPPIEIEEVLHFLKVHRKFYDLDDPNLLQRFAHKLRVGGQRIAQIARKIKLAAIWSPDDNTILIDTSQPKPKQLWASFHDATHRLLPWHRQFFLGDTAQTLEPYYQEILEEEANYGASALMFGPRFSEQAQDIPIGWSAVEQLKQVHKKSLVTVLRRYVEHGPSVPLAGLISTAPWDIVPPDQSSRCRHFVRSSQFVASFPKLEAEHLRTMVDQRIAFRRGGPLGSFQFERTNNHGRIALLQAECFYNQHYVLTLVNLVR
jgi:hypothetical protein